jgi:hypothetical protein
MALILGQTCILPVMPAVRRPSVAIGTVRFSWSSVERLELLPVPEARYQSPMLHMQLMQVPHWQCPADCRLSLEWPSSPSL